MLTVWKALLDATESAAQARISGSENYKNHIYEAAKNCKNQKDIQLKKVRISPDKINDVNPCAFVILFCLDHGLRRESFRTLLPWLGMSSYRKNVPVTFSAFKYF